MDSRKRGFPFVIIILIFFSILSVSAISSDSPLNDWWMFGYNNQNNAWDRIPFTPPLEGMGNVNSSISFGGQTGPILMNEFLYVIGESGEDQILYKINATDVRRIIDSVNLNETFGFDSLYFLSYSEGALYLIVSNHSTSEWEEGGLLKIDANNIHNKLDYVHLPGAMTDFFGFPVYIQQPLIKGGFVYAGNAEKYYQLNKSNLSQIISQIDIYFTRLDEHPIISGDFLFLNNFTNSLLKVNASNISQVLEYLDYTDLMYDSLNVYGIYNDFLYTTGGGMIVGTSYLDQRNISNISEILFQVDIMTLAPISNDAKRLFYDNKIYTPGMDVLNASNISQVLYYSFGLTSSLYSGLYTDGELIYSSDGRSQMVKFNLSNPIEYYEESGLSGGGLGYGQAVFAYDYMYSGLWQIPVNYSQIDYDNIFVHFNYWTKGFDFDNSGELIGRGTAKFYMDVVQSNGTVGLNINGKNYLATKISNPFSSGNEEIYYVSFDTGTEGLVSGKIYQYYWYSYGPGSWHRYRESTKKTYEIEGLTGSASFLLLKENQGSSSNLTIVINETLNESNVTYEKNISFEPVKEIFSSEKGFEKKYLQGEGNNLYYLQIKEVDSENKQVLLDFGSDENNASQEIWVNEGEYKEFDLDINGKNDAYVKVSKIFEDVKDVEIEYGPIIESALEEFNFGKGYMKFLIGGAIVLLAIFFYFFFRRKKKRKK